MTLKVRDEEDVLEANLRFHVAQGVDFFVVTDNDSTDATPQILDRYARAGLVHLLHEPSGDYQNVHGDWVTRMARMAFTDFGADWVINNDADEFWWPVGGGTLDAAFAAIPDGYGLLHAPRPEFAGRPDGPGDWPQRLVFREARSRVRHKIAHRGAADVEVGGGSHRLAIKGPKEGGTPPMRSTKALLRPVTEPDDRPRDERWTPAPRWPARILHLPIRSFEQYRRRVELTVYHGGFELRDRRRALLEAYEAGTLEQLYARTVLDDEGIERGLATGELVQDTGLRDFLAGCPDPLGEGGVQAVREWAAASPAARPSPERAAADVAANELDMMHALARNELAMRWLRAEANQRARRLKRELAEARARVEELEGEAAGAAGRDDERGGRGGAGDHGRAKRPAWRRALPSRRSAR